jgi:hypothetical protein
MTYVIILALLLVAELLFIRQDLPFATTALAIMLATRLATGRGGGDDTFYSSFHEGVFAASDLDIYYIARNAVRYE